ncbi:MAG: RNA polymerase sigma factor [Saprospiraceae bacterium]
MLTVPSFSCEFNNLSDFLRAFAFRLTRDRTAAEDLYQDTALRAFNNQHRFAADTNMKAWLSTIMKNIFINDFRKTKRQRENLTMTGENPIVHHAKKSAINMGESEVVVGELDKIIGELSNDLKIPFLMIYQGYKYEEVSRKFGLPIGTVKSRVFVARRKLRERIRQLYGEASMAALLN